MNLAPGTGLGPYEIVSPLGEGGMGVVYRARDRELGREVAVKVLPPVFSDDPERVARFEREARVLAALNHPNIAAIYGVEEADGARAIVLELVEGGTLADRIARGALPVDEAVALAGQIADALEAAHEKGIVHRDLKPSNILVTSAGTVKVLDFGLSKALVGAASGAASSEMSTTTTMQTPAGLVLGTPRYMSPEQARGETVDKRTDIWAFGCVLYEMLVGRPAFAARDPAAALAAVIHEEPDWTALPAELPQVLSVFLRRCLRKDPAQRLRAAGDIRLALEGAFEPAPSVVPKPRRSVALWLAAIVLFAGVAGGITAWSLKPSEIPRVVRFSHVLPEELAFTQTPRPLVAIAPDGSSMVYVADNRLYRRPMNELSAAPLRGTEGSPTTPFFSPDGKYVGYWDAKTEEIRRIAVSGGAPVTLSRTTNLYGASWGADGWILYGHEDGIWRVQAADGQSSDY